MAVPLHHLPGELECSRLFVYGTLRRGFQNRYARLLSERATLIGSARIRGRLYRVGPYPGARTLLAGDDWIHGELYELRDDSFIRELDRYEGREFRRILVTAVPQSGDALHAWVYEYNRHVRPEQRILSGDFRRR